MLNFLLKAIISQNMWNMWLNPKFLEDIWHIHPDTEDLAWAHCLNVGRYHFVYPKGKKYTAYIKI